MSRRRRRNRAGCWIPVAAWYVGDVLLGTPPPENAPRRRIAFKTGTSYGYRDAWAVGFDGRRAIGVWVGRPDGAPVPGLTGRSVAAPILFEAFARMGRQAVPLPPAPRGMLVATAAPNCRRRCSISTTAACRARRRGAVAHRVSAERRPSRLDARQRGREPLALKITGGVAPLDRDGQRLPRRHQSTGRRPCSGFQTDPASHA